MINVQYESEDSGDETTPRSNLNELLPFNKESSSTLIPNQGSLGTKGLEIEEEKKQARFGLSSAENSFVSSSTIKPNIIKNDTSSCYGSVTDEELSKSQRGFTDSKSIKDTLNEKANGDRFFKPKPRLPSDASLFGKLTPSGIKSQLNSSLLQPTRPINPNSAFQPPKQPKQFQHKQVNESAASKIQQLSKLKELEILQIDSEEEQMSFSISGTAEGIIQNQKKQTIQRENSSNNNSVNNVSVSGSTGQHPAELEEIVKMFTQDLQQSIRQRFKSKAQSGSLKSSGGGSNVKRLPFEIQQMMGQANNLYAFRKFTEAIEILQQIITKMPDHAESYSTISSIYEEMSEFEKSLNFGVMAAFLIKTDIERWQKCADVAKFLGKYPIAIYCLNRAIKQSSEITNQEQIINMKFTKIAIYKLQKDFSSAIRTLTKMIDKFKSIDSARTYQFNLALASTFFEQGQPLKSFEVLDELIELSLSETNNLLEVLLLYGEISQASKLQKQFLEQLRRQSIITELAKAKNLAEHKVTVFQIEIRELICKIDMGLVKKVEKSQLFQETVKELQDLKLIEQLIPYQKVVSSLILLAAKIEHELNQIPSVIELYESLVSICLSIDQPNLLYKIGILYQKVFTFIFDIIQLGNIEKAKEVLELAFLRCPIQQNGSIRIELSTVYNQLGLNKKAMLILKNPFPHQQLGSNTSNADSQPNNSLLKKRKRQIKKSKDEEDIIMSSEEEEDEESKQGHDLTNNDSAHLLDMSDSWNFFRPNQKQNMQPPSIAGSGLIPNNMYSSVNERGASKGTAFKGIKKFMPEPGDQSQSDSVFKRDFKVRKELKFQREKDADGQEREFLLKRNRKLQKRIHGKKEEEERRQRMEEEEKMESSQAISRMKLDLIGFNSESFVMVLEQCKLSLKIGDQEGLVASLDGKLELILENLKIKQDLQDTLYRMNLKEDSPEKEHFFMKKFSANDLEKDSQAKVCQQAKVKIIEEINMYPNIFSQVNTEDFLDILLCYLAQLLRHDRYQQVADHLEIIKQIELIMQLLNCYPQMSIQPKTITQQSLNQADSRQKIFYEIATVAYLLSNQHIKAYKALRQISTPQELLNWAIMGCIISKSEDSSFCRSYFKRIFRTKQVLNPFILMILGNNYLQKQQLDLAIRHFYLPYKSFYNKNQLLNLTLAISYLSQSYQRTNQEKEQTIKRALSLLLMYAESREDRVEVQYNFARALHFMGLNTNARELYEGIVKMNEIGLNSQQKEIRIQAVFNLSQMIKGAGISSGITVVEGANLERMKYHNQRQAHELIMNNIII